MALESQIRSIEGSTGLRMEPCLADVLEGIELLRSENASVADSWLNEITKTVWGDTGLGTSPCIDRIIVECGNGSAIVYEGHRTVLYGWATGMSDPFSVPRGTHIHGLLYWALGPFYEQEWEKG